MRWPARSSPPPLPRSSRTRTERWTTLRHGSRSRDRVGVPPSLRLYGQQRGVDVFTRREQRAELLFAESDTRPGHLRHLRQVRAVRLAHIGQLLI